MKKSDRFLKTFSQGVMEPFEVWVDRETGVNYLWHSTGHAGGMTPLLDREGKPIITTLLEEKE